jgi:hypothetical protein
MMEFARVKYAKNLYGRYSTSVEYLRQFVPFRIGLTGEGQESLLIEYVLFGSEQFHLDPGSESTSLTLQN